MRATCSAFLLLPMLGISQGVLINEVAPGEQDGPDWVELYNRGAQSVDLNGYTFVSGDALHRITGPLVVPARGHTVCWFGSDSLGPQHIPFKLSRKGDALVLVAKDHQRLLDIFTWPDLPAGLAVGRTPDGGADWGYTLHPSPGSPAPRSGHARRLLPAPQPIATDDSLHWTSVAGATLRYTLDGSAPGVDDPLWTGPMLLPMDAVVTVRAFAAEAIPSPCSSYPPPDRTATWSISLRVDPQDLTDSVRGILVDGAAANYTRRGRTWERPAEIALHLLDTCVRIAVDVWVAGSGSRGLAKKSLKVRLRDTPDTTLLPPALRGADEWLLRADATPGAFVHDHFMEQLAAAHAQLEVPRSLVMPLLLNGVYHGVYRVMPAKNGDLVRALSPYGQVDVVSGPGGEVISGDRKAYRRFMEALTGSSSLEALSTQADMESLLDMACLDLWAGRVDAELNTRCWRPRTADGRWRWILFDMDLWAPPQENTVARMRDEPPQAAPYLAALLSDEERTKALLARVTAWNAAGLWGAEAERTMEELRAQHRESLLRDHARWSGLMPMEHPDSSFARLERHISTRAPLLFRHLAEATGHMPERIELRVHPPKAGVLSVEGLPVTDDRSEIVTFAGAPLNIGAMAEPGHWFAGWRHEEEKGPMITVLPGHTKVLTAVFRPLPPSGGDRLEQ